MLLINTFVCKILILIKYFIKRDSISLKTITVTKYKKFKQQISQWFWNTGNSVKTNWVFYIYIQNKLV